MKKEAMIEALAGVEGICDMRQINVGGASMEVLRLFGTNREGEGVPLPNYFTSHDHLQRIIDGLSKEDGDTYHHELIAIIIRDGGQYSWIDIHKATCEQKAEAILKALNLWEGE